jgi:SNF2 family DNA or RNA helicase
MQRLLPKKHQYVLVGYQQGSEQARYEQECTRIQGNIRDKDLANNSCLVENNNILTELLSLRLFCSNGNPDMMRESVLEANTVIPDNTTSDDVEDMLNKSIKLRLCHDLIQSIRQQHPEDKIVIVSNFNSTLDRVRIIAKSRRWGSLRIDGSIPQEKRVKIVEFFNRPVSMTTTETVSSSSFLSSTAALAINKQHVSYSWFLWLCIVNAICYFLSDNRRNSVQ